ncbi:M48 family metallopeptidase [Microbacterium sp. A84]|uniref:M48 family metallopeptidase n=1 Tax=Microbacterium sp. A84 TaxID=3450715 RepID=UPI003F4369C8
MTFTTEYGAHTIAFTIERTKRSTLEIAVQPDGQVRVVAPLEVSTEAVAARVRKRGRWVISQQAYFAQFLPRTPPRRWAPGETHLYLGRQYRLRIVPGATHEPRVVKLIRGFITVTGVEFDDAATIENLVTAWYRQHAEAHLRRRLHECLTRFHPAERFTPTSVQLRTMRTHWGSMSPAGRLSVTPDLVRAPVDAIDYVIVHELCHRAVPNHSREFFELLTRVMPDWERRKARLERALA